MAQPAEGPASAPALVAFARSATDFVVWAGADGPEDDAVSVRVRSAGGPVSELQIPLLAAHGLTGSAELAGLKPSTEYELAAQLRSDAGGRALAHARIRTLPAPSAAAALRVAFTGDVGGMNICRDAARGYPGFDAIRARKPDLFLGMGDMIYADHVCEATGRYGNAQIAGPPKPARNLEGYRAHWRYQLADGPLRRLFAEVPYTPVWDDHEVLNNFGPHHDQRTLLQRHLLPIGRRAFLEWNPIASEGEPRLYRELRLGKHVALFLLDARSYRDSNRDPDGPSKTMLGAEQLAWLIGRLAASDATWNVIVSSVPLAIPSSKPRQRDSWASEGGATGFERELGDILRRAHAAGLRRLIWLTADAHTAMITRYQPLGAEVDFRMLEVTVGPLAAHPASSRTLDPSFGPEPVWSRPALDEDRELELSLDEALAFFNFGLLDVDADGALSFEIVDATGKTMTRLAADAW